MPNWNDTMPGFSGPTAVPASGQQGSGGDPIIQSLIKNISGAYTNEDVQAAVTPIAGGHTGEMPSRFTTPVTPYQPAPMDERRVVGAGNARAQGIGNAFIGAANALGSVVTAEAKVKQGQIRDSAQKVIQAQQGIDEAKQQYDAAKQSGDTAGMEKFQTLISQNEKVRDGVFADPKMRKALQKGFNINYTDPSANKTEEHAAVQEAIKGAKTWQQKREAIKQLQTQQNQQAGAGMGKAYAEQQPQGFAPNVQAQQALQLKMSQQKASQDALKNYMTFKASMAGHSATVSAAQIHEQGALIMKQAEFSHQQDMLDQRFSNAQKLLGSRLNDQFALIDAREKAARKLANEVYTDKETDPLTMYTKTNTAMLKYQDNLAKNQNVLTSLIEERQKDFPEGAGKGKAAKDPQSYQALNAQIALTQQQIAQNQGVITNLHQSAQVLKSFVGQSGGVSDAGGSSSSSSADDSSLGDGTDFTDPSTYLGAGSSEESNSESE